MIVRSPARRALRSALRRGFTLLELMVVILIISILATFLVPRVLQAVERAQVTACQANLRAISTGMIQYRTKYERGPRGSGVAFFTSLIADKVWPADQASTKQLFCPAVERAFLEPERQGLPLADWYKDSSQVNGAWSSYAGRDIRRHPLRQAVGSAPETEAVVADDNDPEANHGTTTNVLWGSGAVFALELIDLQADGTLPNDDTITFIEVGPDSPVESLRKLSLTD